MKKVIIVFLLVLFIPKVKAECSYMDIARLKKIASNVNVTYDYEETDDVIFSVRLVNLNDEIYFIDKSNLRKYYYEGNERIISNYKSGEKITFEFYSINPECGKELLYSIPITLPTYNLFYKDPLCKGIEDYGLCQKWSTNGLSYDNFVKKINDYKNKNKKEEEPPENKPEIEYSLLSVIINFLLKYYIVILLVLIIGSSFGIYRIEKKSDIYN